MLKLLAVMPREIPAADLSLTGLNLTQTHTHGNERWEGEWKEERRKIERRTVKGNARERE